MAPQDEKTRKKPRYKRRICWISSWGKRHFRPGNLICHPQPFGISSQRVCTCKRSHHQEKLHNNSVFFFPCGPCDIQKPTKKTQQFATRKARENPSIVLLTFPFIPSDPLDARGRLDGGSSGMGEPSSSNDHQLRLVVYPSIYRVLQDFWTINSRCHLFNESPVVISLFMDDQLSEPFLYVCLWKSRLPFWCVTVSQYHLYQSYCIYPAKSKWTFVLTPLYDCPLRPKLSDRSPTRELPEASDVRKSVVATDLKPKNRHNSTWCSQNIIGWQV